MKRSNSHEAHRAEPPRLAQALLRLAIPRRDRNYVLADLAEEFEAMLAEGRGLHRARRWYWGQALGSVLPMLKARSRSTAHHTKRRFRERLREMLSTILQDVRYGVRTLAKNPLFTAVALLTLALGVGAGAAIFSVVDGVLLRPLPYRDPGRLGRITVSVSEGTRWGGAAQPGLIDIRERTSSFQAVAGYDHERVVLGDTIDPQLIEVTYGTADLIPMLGGSPMLGRLFSSQEDEADESLAVLSYALWMRRFGGSSGVLGKSVTIRNREYTVIGVMPKGFAFPTSETRAYLPLRSAPDWRDVRDSHWVSVVARLADDVSFDGAQAELNVLAATSTQQYPELYGERGYRIRLESLHESMVGNVRVALFVLLGAVGFVLLIACVNVANLLLSRAEGRKREMAVRAALGAGRRRLSRQLLTESLLLAAAGGLAGLGLAYAGGDALLSLAPESIPRLEEVGIDRRVLGFSLTLVLVTGFVFGIVPALLASRTDVNETLKGGGRTQAGTRGGRLLRRSLVVVQLALAVLLVLGAGIMLRSLMNLYRVDTGLRTAGVLTFRLTPQITRFEVFDDVVRYYEELIERGEALPGVAAAGASWWQPLAHGYTAWTIQIEGRQLESVGDAPSVGTQMATPGYFEALGLKLIRGRRFDERDHAQSAPVVIINERMARELWPGEDPVGKRIKTNGERWPWMEIVGVIRDVKYDGLDADVQPTMYIPHAQGYVSAYWTPWMMTLYLRAEGEPKSLIAPARNMVRDFDRNAAMYDIRTMSEVVDASVGNERFTMVLLSTFAAVALILAAVGAYGVISYGVMQRTQEIGVRLALGAGASDVLGQVIREGLALAALGVAFGIAAAIAISRVFESLVFGITPTDPPTYAAVVLILGATALAASYFPARRASRVDPLVSLRSEDL